MTTSNTWERVPKFPVRSQNAVPFFRAQTLKAGWIDPSLNRCKQGVRSWKRHGIVSKEG